MFDCWSLYVLLQIVYACSGQEYMNNRLFMMKQEIGSVIRVDREFDLQVENESILDRNRHFDLKQSTYVPERKF